MKTEAQRANEIRSYFDSKIFLPAINFAKEQKNTHILRGVNLTRARMFRLSSHKMISYFWNAIVGTEHSIRFSEIMKANNIQRFEDVLFEVRNKFNDKYFRS